MQKNNSDLDWDELRVFLAVARAGQFLGAARRLAVDQATVTRRVRRLEAAVGARLFDRLTTGARLTPAGAELLSRAERIEAEVLQLQASLSTASDAVAGRVRIGAPDGFGTLFLASRLTGLVRRHPGLDLALVALPRSFSLSKREVEVAITVERPTAGRLTVQKLTDYTLSLYANPAYLEEAGPVRSRADLRRHRHVTYVPDLLFAPSLDLSDELGIANAPAFQCASVLGQMEAVSSGMGLGLLHDYAAVGRPDLVPVLPRLRFRRTYWIVGHADTAASQSVRAVRDYVVAAVAAERASFVRR